VDLKRRERDFLAEHYLTHPEAEVRRRCHIVMLLDDGLSRRRIQQVTHTSADEVENCLTRFGPAGSRGYWGTAEALGPDNPRPASGRPDAAEQRAGTRRNIPTM
jgi:hypothetical protein